MITVVALLFFPVVLAMSVYRLYQLPRDILAGTKWFNRGHRAVAVLASSTTYVTLGLYTAILLVTLVGVLSRLPETIGEAIAAASMLIGYPLVYLVYEWVYHYALDPRPRNH
jgi:hypothetical protein